MSEPGCSLQLDLHWGSVFASRLRTRVFNVLFSFVNWILSGSWSRHRVIFSKLLSEPACSSQVDLHWASLHLPWGVQRICWPFILEFIREILSTSMFFCCSIYIETAQNSSEECNEFADLLFWRLSLCLSRDSLSYDIRSLDLCILFKFLFLYLWYIPPHSCAFHTFYFTPIFSYVYYHAKHFNFLSLMTLLLAIKLLFIISAVKGLIWSIFFFLTFIVLIQLNFPWNISTNLLIFTNKVSSHVVIVW